MITKTRWKNLDALSLENDALRVIVLPALGGKLASVFHKKKNFELAAQNQEAFCRLPHVGNDFSKYDASGLDDAFPSIDPCASETLGCHSARGAASSQRLSGSRRDLEQFHEKPDFAGPGDSLVYESPLSLFLSEDPFPFGRKTPAGIRDPKYR